MKCLALKHVAFEDLGVFESELKSRRFEIEYRQAGVDSISDKEWLAFDLVIVLGGPIGVYEQEKYPWIAEEIAGVKMRMAEDLPILGICLGAQIMAAALGARVYAGKEKEIGWGTIQLTDDGKKSPLSELEGAPVLHWHGDTFEAPAGAKILAYTRITERQAFSHGRNALALQFHPETEGKKIERWLIGHTAELAHAGVSVPALRAATRSRMDHAASAGLKMLSSWLGEIGLSH